MSADIRYIVNSDGVTIDRAKFDADTYNMMDAVTNLNAVTTATDGDTINSSAFREFSVFVNVSVNTGAVTVSIQVSPDDTTWYTRDSKTYTAETGTNEFYYKEGANYIRAITSTQSSSTVTVKVSGRS